MILNVTDRLPGRQRRRLIARYRNGAKAQFIVVSRHYFSSAGKRQIASNGGKQAKSAFWL
jgi:hypothetical protein